MPKMNNVHLKGTLLGKSIAVSCCCSPALCGALHSFNILRFGCNFAKQAIDDRKN